MDITHVKVCARFLSESKFTLISDLNTKSHMYHKVKAIII